MRLALNIYQFSSKENVGSSECNVIVLNNTNDHLYQIYIMLYYEIIGRITIFVSVNFFSSIELSFKSQFFTANLPLAIKALSCTCIYSVYNA